MKIENELNKIPYCGTFEQLFRIDKKRNFILDSIEIYELDDDRCVERKVCFEILSNCNDGSMIILPIGTSLDKKYFIKAKRVVNTKTLVVPAEKVVWSYVKDGSYHLLLDSE